jgi:hypothetical protein
VVCFQPLKHYYVEIIDRAVRLKDSEFTRVEFLAAFDHMRAQAFKPLIIKSAFQKTGLYSFDPEMVMQQFYEL